MPVTFVAYIDESGDTGLETVKKPDDPRGATLIPVCGRPVTYAIDRAADVRARTALRSEPRDDPDDQVDLIWQERVEIDECVSGERRQLDVCR